MTNALTAQQYLTRLVHILFLLSWYVTADQGRHGYWRVVSSQALEIPLQCGLMPQQYTPPTCHIVPCRRFLGTYYRERGVRLDRMLTHQKYVRRSYTSLPVIPYLQDMLSLLYKGMIKYDARKPIWCFSESQICDSRSAIPGGQPGQPCSARNANRLVCYRCHTRRCIYL